MRKEFIGGSVDFYSPEIQFTPVCRMMLFLTVWISQHLHFKCCSSESSTKVSSFSETHFFLASLSLQSRKVCVTRNIPDFIYAYRWCADKNNPLSKKSFFLLFLSVLEKSELSCCELDVLLGWAQEMICRFCLVTRSFSQCWAKNETSSDRRGNASLLAALSLLLMQCCNVSRLKKNIYILYFCYLFRSCGTRLLSHLWSASHPHCAVKLNYIHLDESSSTTKCLLPFEEWLPLYSKHYLIRAVTCANILAGVKSHLLEKWYEENSGS